MAGNGLQFDRIGVWSEIKLEILKNYASAYSRILAAQKNLYHVYIDAFAGAGFHQTKETQTLVLGSPLNALNIQPKFRKYYLIDIEPQRVESLKETIGKRDDVVFYEGDCNKILIDKVFPQVRYEDYRRGLCILDPYGLDLDWAVMQEAGRMKTLDMFLNFPVMDMNRNVLWRNPGRVETPQKERMTAFWGDESWKGIAYRTDTTLFGEPDKQSNESIAEAFRIRLRDVAGFARVPKPMPMRNSTGAIVYYLFFASQNSTGQRIVLDIFKKYRRRGEQ